MCIACELGFLNMLEAMSPEARERFLREHEEATRPSCDVPPQNSAPQPSEDERAP